MAPTSPSMQDKGPVPAQSMSKTASKAHEKPTGGLSTLTWLHIHEKQTQKKSASASSRRWAMQKVTSENDKHQIASLLIHPLKGLDVRKQRLKLMPVRFIGSVWFGC